jgi:hypothetical protein
VTHRGQSCTLSAPADWRQASAHVTFLPGRAGSFIRVTFLVPATHPLEISGGVKQITGRVHLDDLLAIIEPER